MRWQLIKYLLIIEGVSSLYFICTCHFEETSVLFIFNILFKDIYLYYLIIFDTPTTIKHIFKMLDKWIETIYNEQFISEHDLKILCDKVKEILMEESNVQPVSACSSNRMW